MLISSVFCTVFSSVFYTGSFSCKNGFLSMSLLPKLTFRSVMLLGTVVGSILVGEFVPTAIAQDSGTPKTDVKKSATPYVPAIDLLPDTVAGLVRVPDVPAFCDAWKTTNIGQLLESPSMQPFIEAQRKHAKGYLQNIGNKLGIRLEDVYAMGSGELVIAWLPFERDKRRPFALVAVSDIRGRSKEASDVLAQIDKDLKAGGWDRTDKKHRGAVIRVYGTKPKPGQLKIDQIAITMNESRVIASDRDTVVKDLLDAIAGDPKRAAISQYPDFKTVLTRSARAIREPAQKDGGVIALEWYAKPFQMGRIVRESLEIDRGNQVDLLKLLENQGFDAIKAAGGIIVMAGNNFDFLHKGFVLAPPTTTAPSKYEKAARILQFVNQPVAEIPTWVGKDTASINRLNIKMEEAFWATESLVNEALNDDLFRDIIDGIRDDEDGTQIDIPRDVLPNLDDRLLLLTDNTLPADISSERMLIAIRIKNGAVIRNTVRKWMEAEPDATKQRGPGGVEIWRVERNEEDDENFGADLFDDFDEEETVGGAPPLLNQWAIALIDKGPGSSSAYLMFSSHDGLLIDVAKRIQKGGGEGLGGDSEIKQLISAQKDLGVKSTSFDRWVRTRMTLRVKYELLRTGKLKESDSVIASIIRRMAEEHEGDELKELDASLLPPLSEVEKYFSPGSSSFTTVNDGWEMTGFFLK